MATLTIEGSKNGLKVHYFTYDLTSVMGRINFIST